MLICFGNKDGFILDCYKIPYAISTTDKVYTYVDKCTYCTTDKVFTYVDKTYISHRY